MNKALYVDSCPVAGAFIAPSVTAHIESTSGVAVGVARGADCGCGYVMFLLVMFFSPLVCDGSSLRNRRSVNFCWRADDFRALARVNWDDFTESVPAFITTVMMPLYFLDRRIALGFMSYCIMKSVHRALARSEPVCGGGRKLLLFALKIILVD